MDSKDLSFLAIIKKPDNYNFTVYLKNSKEWSITFENLKDAEELLRETYASMKSDVEERDIVVHSYITGESSGKWYDVAPNLWWETEEQVRKILKENDLDLERDNVELVTTVVRIKK